MSLRIRKCLSESELVLGLLVTRVFIRYLRGHFILWLLVMMVIIILKSKIGILFTWGSTKNGNIGVALSSKAESTHPVKVKLGYSILSEN